VATASSAYVDATVATSVIAHRLVPGACIARRPAHTEASGGVKKVPFHERTYRTYVNTYRTYGRPGSQVDSVRTVRTLTEEARVIAEKHQPRRSTLPKEEARRRYVEIGELVALEQIKKDSESLDDHAIAVGPFARLDANAVAAHDGKTRGAISNLFGSQAAFQAETMALALSAADWVEKIEYPAPADFPTADAWLDAVLAAESARGPAHGSEPALDYGTLWALWLSAVPYGLWSEEVSRPSMEEHAQTIDALAQALTGALDHFGLTLREDTTPNDVACALASLVEGVWLNQCLTTRHPSDPEEPIATEMLRSGRLVWRGAVEPPG